MAFGQAANLSLKGRALRLLAAREQSRAELQRRLASFEEQPGELKTVLDELGAKGFIDEQRVVDSLVYRRSGKLGSARIRHELQGKGLDPAMVLDAVAGLQASEFARAREIWQKKFGATPGNASERGKQMRFLVSRGFSGDVIRRVLGGEGED